MNAASIAELKKALLQLEREDLLDACLRLARFKKDNKELLTYLLFLSGDEQAYADYLCEELDSQFAQTMITPKKTLRKTIRWMDKCLRFSGVRETEVQVRTRFCVALDSSRIPYRGNRVIYNMYTGQLKKIHAAIAKLHPDLQFEFLEELKQLD